MTSDLDKNVLKAIKALYESNKQAQALFDAFANRKKDASATSIDNMSNTLNITRGDAVALARELEEANCGRFIVGRKGQKSRFEWDYSVISLGRAAAGESIELDKPQDPIAEVDEEPSRTDALPFLAPASAFSRSIAEAKQMLSSALGVSVESIEITVKS